MKRYIRASAGSSGKYIGGKLYELPDSFWDDDESSVTRNETLNAYVNNYKQGGYFIIYRPDSEKYKFELLGGPDILYDITEGMRIKDGIDLVDYKDHLDVIGYYSGSEDIIKLYPVNVNKAIELSKIIENADFNESTVIDSEIAQYAWGGASAEDVLRTWG